MHLVIKIKFILSPVIKVATKIKIKLIIKKNFFIFSNLVKKIAKKIKAKIGAEICAKNEPATNSFPKKPESLPS